MKILFLSDNFFPEVNAPAVRTYEHCKEWVKMGHQVTVITCFPNFPTGKVFNGYKNKLFLKEELDGINVIRIWSYISPNSGFYKRTLDFLSYAIMSFLFGCFQKFDVVIGTSPQFFTALSAKMISFFKMKPWVFEIRDLWPESIVAVGAINENSLLFKLLTLIEHSFYRSSLLNIVVTNSFKKHIDKLVVNTSKNFVVRNGIDVNSFFVKSVENNNLINYENKFVISYIGTHGMAHALNFILDCIKDLDSNLYHFLFIGGGAEKNNLINQSKKLKLTNVTFLPFVPKNKVINYLNITDASLVNLKKSDTFKNVIPSKIFDSIAMNIPILLGVDGEAREIIEKHSFGIFYKPENKKSFLDACVKIKNIKYNSKAFVDENNRSKLAEIMINKINDFLTK
tara:strand:- start:3450 stop:4640 length:1191 start_codon:yes stop_codon:yes gene_type:complete